MVSNSITKLWGFGGAWVVQNGQVLSSHFHFNSDFNFDSDFDSDSTRASTVQIPLLSHESVAIVSQASL